MLGSANATSAPVNFALDIEPLLRTHCVDCHSPQGIGPFSLVTYQDVNRRRRQIAEVTESRFMPPWKPASDYGPELRNERRLADEEIAMLSHGFESGMAAGDLSSVPPPRPPEEGWEVGEPDLVLSLPPLISCPRRDRTSIETSPSP